MINSVAIRTVPRRGQQYYWDIWRSGFHLPNNLIALHISDIDVQDNGINIRKPTQRRNRFSSAVAGKHIEFCRFQHQLSR